MRWTKPERGAIPERGEEEERKRRWRRKTEKTGGRRDSNSRLKRVGVCQ